MLEDVGYWGWDWGQGLDVRDRKLRQLLLSDGFCFLKQEAWSSVKKEDDIEKGV